MQQTITEFFELIYEATKQQLPQFLVEHHNFQVRAALRNPDFADPEVVAREHQYQNMLNILVENYHKVSAIMAATPEPLQWAMLTLLGNSVEAMTEDMNLEPQVRTTIMGGLADVLNNHEVTPEEMQQAAQVLVQIQEQQAAAAAVAAAPQADQGAGAAEATAGGVSAGTEQATGDSET